MPYEKLKEIGRGTFGIVDLVRDESGFLYARKTFASPNFPGVSLADMRARFEREVKYQSALSHPNIVQILGHNLTDDPPWFTMPVAQGSLADDLSSDRTLGGDPRKPLFDILAGLEAMHKQGYKHRDLKPANVLKYVSPDGSVTYAISDFGLMAPDAGITSTLTGSNMGGGTPMYRPPECAINFRRATAQADIYSFGAILHDIFGGGAPRIPHMELTVAGVLGPIVEKCTKRSPRRRYNDISSLREELFAALSDENLVFTSREEKRIVSLLSQKDSLTDDEWDEVFAQIDENIDNRISNDNIVSSIKISHINQLGESAPELFMAIGEMYAEYAMSGTFGFDYCDVILSRAWAFYRLGDLSLQALVAVAMLRLGTSHNRWAVEHAFVSMAGSTISDDLAERIKIELQVRNVDVKRQVNHIEISIRTSREKLHPILVAMLK